jgi:hypothetical protein
MNRMIENLNESNNESSEPFATSVSPIRRYSDPGSIGTSTIESLIDEAEYYFDIYDVQVYDADIFEEIADYEDSLPYTDCVNNEYCIGTYSNIDNELILSIRVHLKTFYKYTQDMLVPYMYYSSEIPMHERRISVRTHVLQVVILEDDTFTVVVKTHWIRIIQRTWRRVFKQRSLYVLCLKKIAGRYSPLQDRLKRGLGQYPGLRGMLSSYNHKYADDNTIIRNFIA